MSFKEIATEFVGCFHGWNLHKPQIPALTWLPQYDWKKDILSDIGAGLTVFFTLIPQGLAYSALAGMPPVYGLYAAGFPVIIYAFLGSSKHLVMGPYAITSLLVALVCEQYPYEHGGEMYVKLALTLTLMSGIISLVAGIFKMGNIVQYLSSSVMSGFLTGCAILIIISQVRHVCGISMHGMSFNYTHQKIIYLLSHLGETSPIELAFSIPAFAVLYGANRWKRSNPNTPDKAKKVAFQIIYTMVNSSYFMVFLICTVICSEIQHGPNPMKINVVGFVPPGIQPTMFDSAAIPSDVIVGLIPESFMIAFVAFSSNWAVVKRYADTLKYTADPSQELFASGITNIIGSLCFNSFVNAGGMARTAVNVEAGGRSQISCALAAILILITLGFFTALTYNIPMAVLGSIIIAAVLSLVDTDRIYNTYFIDKKECAVMLVTFLFTVFIGIAAGIVLGIIISMAAALLSSAFPVISQYGVLTDEKTGHRLYRDMDKNPLAQEIPGVGIIRMHANLYFANASYLKEIALRLANGDFHTDKTDEYRIRAIIVDMSASMDIDGLGLINLQEIHSELKLLNVAVFFVNFRGMMLEKTQQVDFFKKAGQATLQYKTTDEAAQDLVFKTKTAMMADMIPKYVPSTGQYMDAVQVEISPPELDLIPNPLSSSKEGKISMHDFSKRLLPS